MIEESDAVVVLKGPQADLERFALRLEEGGIEAEVIRPDEHSGSS